MLSKHEINMIYEVHSTAPFVNSTSEELLTVKVKY